MYLNNKSYIDTEFALTLDDKTQIRIDLVRLSEDGKICLVLADNKLALQYSDDFVHFPNNFLISRQNLQNE